MSLFVVTSMALFLNGRPPDCKTAASHMRVRLHHTKALCPVIARPTMSVFISRVPS